MPQGLHRYISYPLYLPDGIRDIQADISHGRLNAALHVLERRAELGSHAASTVLAYLYLQGALVGGENFDRAGALLRVPAAAGDPYALYVLGWLIFLRDKDAKRAVACWLQGAEQGFSPSVLELGRFLAWDLPGKPQRYPAAFVRLEEAHKLGHKQAAGLMATMDLSGARGSLRAAIAAARLPFLYLRLRYWLNRDVFAVNVFSRPIEQRRPFVVQ